jgi:PAS domain S-box-containing protein
MSNSKDKIYRRLQQDLRIKTEERLACAEPAKKSVLTPIADVILQELQAHQIALEMQNENLRRTQATLEASRTHYLELYDLAPVGYLTLTLEGRIAEINLTGAKLLGVERKKLLNRCFTQFIADEYKDGWYRHFIRAKQADGIHACELPFRLENGTTLHFHLDFQYIDINDTPPKVHVTLTDVTERKLAEKELRIAAAAFETQEGMIVADANKVILRVNRAFTHITGYCAEDAIGKLPSFLRSGLNGEDYYQALWASVVSDRYWQGELWNKRKNGEIYPVWQTITAVTDANGVITHYVGAFTDITLRKQTEKVLLDARERLENQVATSKEELQKIKSESAEINSVLNVLLKHWETEKSDAQLALSHEVKGTILPFLEKLKKGNTNQHQIRLLNILETNLQHLVQSFGCAYNLTAAYQQLTPVETQVASLIKQGLPTKVIATSLNISPGTVSIHRKHIRKKLGLLNGKSANLHSYLQQLTE